MWHVCLRYWLFIGFLHMWKGFLRKWSQHQGCLRSRTAWTVLLDTWCDSWGWCCAGPGVELNNSSSNLAYSVTREILLSAWLPEAIYFSMKLPDRPIFCYCFSLLLHSRKKEIGGRGEVSLLKQSSFSFLTRFYLQCFLLCVLVFGIYFAL